MRDQMKKTKLAGSHAQAKRPTHLNPHGLIRKRKSWRDLTDEEQWAKIYAGRAAKAAAAPKSVKEAVALAFPAYVMHMAIVGAADHDHNFIRKDTEVAVVSSIAKVASLLRPIDRETLAEHMHKHYLRFRRTGFYTGHTEFLYAAAAATVKLCDENHYPADAPALMAAFILKEDADNPDNDWNLSRHHSRMMAGTAFDQYLETGLYHLLS